MKSNKSDNMVIIVRLILIILVCLILFFTGIEAITYSGNVTVSGDGRIQSSTYTPIASDAVNSGGESQDYSRSFSFGSESESFNSAYLLKNSHGHDSSYMVAMNGINEKLQHKARIDGNSDINSTISINRRPVFNKDSDAEKILKLTDSFSIGGKDSKISESVIDLKLGFHPVALVATVVEGEDVSILSGLTEDSTGFSSELDQIKAKLPPSNRTLISVFGNAINATTYSSLNKTNLTTTGMANFDFNVAADFEYNKKIPHVEV
ncbi:MAG: hypothetical protein M0Q13_10540 [Methanothrix sp.]|jgi:hypothetical protein|nr:hypothetical protein [Methanothrix sp.]